MLRAASALRSPFSSLDYVQAVADAAGLRVSIHLSGEDTANGVGAAVTWRRRGPYREVILPPFTPFTAILVRKPLSEADVHARSSPFEQLLKQMEDRYHAVRLHLPPALADVRPAQWRGWAAEPLYTYRITNATSDPSAWSSSTARNFRSSRGEYEQVEGRAAAEAAVQLALASYRRSGRPAPLSETALAALVDRLREAGLAMAFAVRRKGTGDVEASVVAVRDDRSAYYWLAGSRPGNAMTVLIGEMLPRLFDTGIESFDFVGANTPSIAEFKRRFGAELLPYFRLVRYMRPDLKLLYAFRKMMR